MRVFDRSDGLKIKKKKRIVKIVCTITTEADQTKTIANVQIFSRFLDLDFDHLNICEQFNCLTQRIDRARFI